MPKNEITIAIVLFAINPIKFKGKTIYQKEFTMDDEDHARALVDVGSAKDVDGYFNEDADFDEDALNKTLSAENKEPVKGKQAETETPVSNERIELIKNAITKLDPATKSHWDKNSKPKLQAITKITGSIIQAEELDYVWALING